jgi:hypothetical protein
MNTDKNHVATENFLKAVLYILRETFEGSPAGQGSAYLDRGIGFLGTLETLTAEQASREVNGTTAAAQTEHAKFYLDRLCEFMQGRTEPVKWEQSWLIETVSEEEWKHLREGMQKSYEEVLRCFAAIETWDEDSIGDAIAIVAHTAYHLGAVRQIAKAV